MSITEPSFQLFSSFRFDRQLLECHENTTMNGGTPSPFYMLTYHRDRMLQAAERFCFPAATAAIQGSEGLIALQSKLESELDTQSMIPLRVKTLLSYDGNITVESNPTPPVPLQNLFPSQLPFPRGHDPAAKMKVSSLTGGALTLGHAQNLPGSPEQTNAWAVIPDTKLTSPTDYTSYKTTSRDMYEVARTRVGIKTMTDPKEVLIISEPAAEVMECSLTTPYLWRNDRWITPPTESGGQIGTTRRWALEKGIVFDERLHSSELVEGEECWLSNGVRGFIWAKVQLHG